MSELWVVVPAFNEEQSMAACLDSLAGQTDPEFQVVVVDNSSTDGTARIVADWFDSNPKIRGELIEERRKGTGAAADTGFRYAIDSGADWVARTDADCLVDSDWVRSIKSNSQGATMLGGKARPRTDDQTLSRLQRVYLPLVVAGARLFGKLRPSNRDPAYLCPYVMCVGNNLAVESDTYLASGGFPRLAIEELPIPNDRALVNRVRKVSSEVRYVPDMIVYNSTRRLHSYGLVGTLRWYADHTLVRPDLEVDVR